MRGSKSMLTSQEREIVLMVAYGLKDQQIARKLSIPAAAVKSQLREIFRKLGVSDRLMLAFYAAEHKL